MIGELSETEDTKCTGLKLRRHFRKSWAEIQLCLDFFLKWNFMEYANPNKSPNTATIKIFQLSLSDAKNKLPLHWVADFNLSRKPGKFRIWKWSEYNLPSVSFFWTCTYKNWYNF